MHANDLIGGLNRGGECDRCHSGNVMLYGLEGDEEGDWGYCLRCARLEAQAALRRWARREARV